MEQLEQVATPVLNVSASLQSNLSDKGVQFKFENMLFSHRHQRYLIVRIVDTLNNYDLDDPLAGKKAARMWWFYHTSHKHHAHIEEEFVHPALMKANFPSEPIQPKELINLIESQHEEMEKKLDQMDEKFKQLEEAKEKETIEKLKNEALEMVISYTKENHRHICIEEAKVVPLINQLDMKEKKRVEKAVMAWNRTLPESKCLFLGLRDVAVSNPEDQRLWNNRLPWFVRHILLSIFSSDALYADYLQYFPALKTTKIDVNEKFQQIVS